MKPILWLYIRERHNTVSFFKDCTASTVKMELEGGTVNVVQWVTHMCWPLLSFSVNKCPEFPQVISPVTFLAL